MVVCIVKVIARQMLLRHICSAHSFQLLLIMTKEVILIQKRGEHAEGVFRQFLGLGGFNQQSNIYKHLDVGEGNPGRARVQK